jgi:transcriptional regulator with XRE-family HTH domain
MTRDVRYYQELGQRVQRIRKRRGLTQESLASMVGLTRTSMVNIERGRQKVLAHTLVRLARALQVEIEEVAPDPAEEMKIDEILNGLPEQERELVRSAIAQTEKKK